MNNHIPQIIPSDCDDYQGYFPLKSITIDKLISCTSDLEKEINDISILLDNKINSIPAVQSKNIINDTIITLESCLMSLLNYIKLNNSLQLKPFAASNSNAYSLFYDYVQICIQVYNQKIFYKPTLFPITTFFTNLCSCYIDALQSPSPTLRKDFLNSWNGNYSISVRLYNFYKEVEIPQQFSKLDRFLAEVKTSQIANDTMFSIYQSISTLRKDIRAFETEEDLTTLIKNTLIDAKTLRSNFADLDLILNENKEEKVLGGNFSEKVSLLDSFICTLNTCVSYYNLTEMSTKLNVLLQNDTFLVSHEMTQSPYSNMACFKIAIQCIRLNLKIMAEILMALNQTDQKVINVYKLSTAIVSNLNDKSSNDPKIAEMVTQLINDVKEIQTIQENSLGVNFANFYGEQIDNLPNYDDKKSGNSIKKHFENYKNYTKLYNENSNLSSSINRFSSFLNFEDFFRNLMMNTVFSEYLKADENLFKIKYYLNFNTLVFINQSLTSQLSKLFRRMSFDIPKEAFYSIKEKNDLNSYLESMLNSICNIYVEGNEADEKDTFVSFFKVFLKAGITVLNLNDKGQYQEVISFFINSFPPKERIKSIVSLQSYMTELKLLIARIQSTFIYNNDPNILVREFQPLSRSNGINEAALRRLFDCEKQNFEIMNSFKIVEIIRQFIRFYMNYSAFIDQYHINSNPISEPQEQPNKALILDFFKKFSNKFIYLLKSNKLRIIAPPELMKEWIGFIRNVLLNEPIDVDRLFTNVVNELPFVDYSKLIHQSLFNFLKIDSIVRQYFKDEKSMCQNEQTMIYLKEKERKYYDESISLKNLLLKLINFFKFDTPSYDIGQNTFVSKIFQISSNLYNKIQKYWSKLFQIFPFYEKLFLILHDIDEIKSKLKIEKDEFPSDIFKYINIILSIDLSLREISKSDYISNELKMMTTSFSQYINQTIQSFKGLFDKDIKMNELDILVPLVIRMKELEKVLMQSSNVFQFTSSIRNILARFLPLIASTISDQTYSKAENVIKDILQLIELFEKDSSEDKFFILYEIESKAKLIKLYHDPLFTQLFVRIKKTVNCEMKITFIKSQILVHNIFILQNFMKKTETIDALIYQNPYFHSLDDIPPICQVPEISKKFEYVIAKYSPKKKSKGDKDDAETAPNELLQKLMSALADVKSASELRTKKIVTMLSINREQLGQLKGSVSNYMKLKSVYDGKVAQLEETKRETQVVRAGQRQKLSQVQQSIQEAYQKGLELAFEFKKLTEIEKTQQEFFIKSAMGDLNWAKSIVSNLKNSQNDKRLLKPMNPVLPAIRNELNDENNMIFNSNGKDKPSYSKLIEIEQRFQKAVEKNKELWEKAKNFTSKNRLPSKVKDKQVTSQFVESELKSNLDISDEEIKKDFDSIVESVYEIFKRSSCIQQLMFSPENEFAGNSNDTSGSSSSISSAHSSGQINFVQGTPGSCDEDEMIEMVDAFNDELFDKALKFYFVNKILQRKVQLKSRRKVKVKKYKKSAVQELMKGESLD